MPRLNKLAAVGTILTLLLGVAIACPNFVPAQEPERPEAPPEEQEADTAAADTLVIRSFPEFPAAASGKPGLAHGWDLPDLLSSSALSFADLLEFTTFLDPLRAGFLEGPQAAIFAGSGGGGFRYDLDGFEIAPLGGGALDLHLISMVELESLQLNRDPGGYRLTSQSYRNPRGEPYSRIEAGTGDQRANLLRAFLSTGIGKALVGFGYDQIDTDGVEPLGASQRSVLWANLAYALPLGVWGQVEYRGTSADRTDFPDPRRTDVILRLRRPLPNGWYADVVGGYSSLSDSVNETPRDFGAGQVAVRAAKMAEHWRAQLSLRAWTGDGVPNFEPEASLEVTAGPASFYASGRYEDWSDFSAASGYAALEVNLPLGVRALAEFEEGDRGLYGGVPRRRYQFTRWTAGGEIKLWSWTVGGRGGRWRTDPSPALGPPADSAVSLPGGTVTVGESWARGPLAELFGGMLEAGGWFRWREAGLFYYWPQTSWQAEGQYHVRALRDQLDVWVKGMGGTRGTTRVPDPDVPDGVINTADENWFRAEIIVRIKDFHFFYSYEYFNAATGPVDIPGFVLPRARSHYGVKWQFWN